MKKRIFRKILCIAAALAACAGLYRISTLQRLKAGAPVFAPSRFSAQVLVIDAGHGGEDGGAVSPSGTVESKLNLEIAKKVDQIAGLFGVRTVMLRSEDISLHSSDASTLREKKVSDLKNRVAAVQKTEGAVLISIHQNTYSSSKYAGAQVFFANTPESAEFAVFTQECLRLALNPGNQRQAAKIPSSVYLMQHVSCRAILVECGFLSNRAEETLLVTGTYQTKIAAALTGAYLGFEQNHPKGGEALNGS